MTPQPTSCLCPTCGQPLPVSDEPILDLMTGILTYRGQAARKLTHKPALILDGLLRAKGRAASREYLIACAWPSHEPANADECLRVNLYRVRKVLEPLRIRIINHHGQGYTLYLPHKVTPK